MQRKLEQEALHAASVAQAASEKYKEADKKAHALAAEFEALFADMPEPRNEPGGSPTPKLATPLAGLSKPQEDEPPATGETPEPSPQPA